MRALYVCTYKGGLYISSRLVGIFPASWQKVYKVYKVYIIYVYKFKKKLPDPYTFA